MATSPASGRSRNAGTRSSISLHSSETCDLLIPDNPIACTRPSTRRVDTPPIQASWITAISAFSELLRQDTVDDPGERVELRTRRWSPPPIPGRYRERQHLGHCPRVNPKLPRCFPSAQTLDLYRVTNQPIKLHHLHPPPSAITPKGYLLPYSGATGPTGRFHEGFLLRRLQLRLAVAHQRQRQHVT
jgi:hypothetical protein